MRGLEDPSSCAQQILTSIRYLCDDSPRFGPTVVTSQEYGDVVAWRSGTGQHNHNYSKSAKDWQYGQVRSHVGKCWPTSLKVLSTFATPIKVQDQL